MNTTEFEQALAEIGVSVGTTAGPLADPRIYPVDAESFIIFSQFIQEKRVLKRATSTSTTYYAVAYWKTWTTTISNSTNED
jgi:hypothetical protein